MGWSIFKVLSRADCLGIDIGTSRIKLVELLQKGNSIHLSNYGDLELGGMKGEQFTPFRKSGSLVSVESVAEVVRAIMQEAEISSENAVFTIPDFSSFFTTIPLPLMEKDEVGRAVEYAARLHIPLPLAEVTLDWKIVKGTPGKTPLEVLLVSIPNDVVEQYQRIASLANLNLVALDAEVFALHRAVNNSQGKTFCLIDLGFFSTSITIVDEDVVRASHTVNVSAADFTRKIAGSENIEFEEAEEVKRALEDSEDEEKNTRIMEAVDPLIEKLAEEITRVSDSFTKKEKKEISEIVLAGGGVCFRGFEKAVSRKLQKRTRLIDPFVHTKYPKVLEEELPRKAPMYSVAVGGGLRGLSILG